MDKIIGVVIIDSNMKIFQGESPKNHSDLVYELTEFYENLSEEELPKIIFQGFYIETGIILSRHDAYVLARQTGQSKVECPRGKLFSKDLW